MKIALEIPLPHLQELSELADFDFALAHVILEQGENGALTRFYRAQAEKGREVWLDNGFHELKYSVTMHDLFTAADLICATHLVAPEIRSDARKTMYHIQKTCEFNQHRTARGKRCYKIVGSWQGFKRELHELLKECDEVALPFDRPRVQILESDTSLNSKQFHYFGYRSLDELRRYPPKSIDTSMPIRAAILGIDLEQRERRPHTALLDFSVRMSDGQLEQAKYNIKLMRKAAEGR